MRRKSSGPPDGRLSHRSKSYRRMISVVTFVVCAAVWFIVGALVARC
jgi:hypothetical protein